MPRSNLCLLIVYGEYVVYILVVIFLYFFFCYIGTTLQASNNTQRLIDMHIWASEDYTTLIIRYCKKTYHGSNWRTWTSVVLKRYFGKFLEMKIVKFYSFIVYQLLMHQVHIDDLNMLEFNFRGVNMHFDW